MGFLKNEQLKLPLYFLVIMLCSCTDGRIMLEGQLYQGFACYGDHEEYSFINATCPSGSVIAPGDITYGAKLRNLTECTGYILRNDTPDYYQLCCKPGAANGNTDCLLVKESDSPYQFCTGRAACIPRIQAQWLPLTYITCDNMQNDSVYYTSFTSYMIFNYFCVEETRVYAVNSVDATVSASIIYLWNKGYPNSSIPANMKETCSIEMENCSATISVITVHVNLPTVSNGTCNHTIKILTSNGKVVQTLSCAVYKYINSLYKSNDTYLYIETENVSINQSWQYWLGFQATTTNTFHVSCPGKNRTYCIPTTTTPATTSTTTTITTSTTTSTPTPMTTRNETQGPSTSTTTQTTTSNTPSSIPTTSPTSTPSSTTTANSTSQYSGNDSNIGIILGVVLGSVAVMVVIIVLCILWRKSKKRTNIPTEETMIESTSSHLQLRNGVAPTDHFVVTSKPRQRKHKKLKANFLDQEDYEISKRKIERKKRRERKKEKIRRKRKDTIQAAKNMHVEGGETIEDQTSFPSDHPNSDAPIRSIYGTETAEMGQTDRGNGENGKTKNEKRRKKTKKKHKHKEHHVYNTIVQTADKDQSDLQIGHTEGVNVGESQLRAHSDIVDKTKTMLKGDAVPDDTKKHRRKRKKLHSEPVRVMEDTEQEGNEDNGKSHGKKKKKRKKHAQKEDKRHSYDVDERLPPFEEPVHRFENEVYPSSDSN